jgi:CRISPR-associated protein Cpf1
MGGTNIMKTTIFKDFTNQYSVSKTLRFELIPQGKTQKHIESKNFLRDDEELAEKYKKVKKIIDEYHKDFIEKALSGLKLKGLKEYMGLYLKQDKDDKDKKSFEVEKSNLRKQIAKAFKDHDKFKTLFAKELIKEELTSFTPNEEKDSIKEFENFTTYFTGFHQNRENMYKADEQATAIAYRLVHENLPKFIDNVKIFERIKNEAPELASQLNNVLRDMKDIVKGKTLDEIFSVNYFNETLTQKGIDIYNALIGGRSAEEGKTKIKGLNECINTDFNQKQSDKKKRQPKFKQLYKQILSDRHIISFIPEAFKTDNEVMESIENFYSNELLNYSVESESKNVFEVIKNAVSNLNTFNLSKIFLKAAALTDVSQKTFGDWNTISRALQYYYEKTNPMKPKEKPEKFEERKGKWLKQDFDIGTLQTVIDQYDNDAVKKINDGKVIVNYFARFSGDKGADLIQKVIENYKLVKDLLNTPYPKDEKLGSNKEQVNLIKAFLDSIMDIVHFVKPLSIKKDADKEKDELFYSLFTPFYEQLTLAIPLYNKVRNYLTQKPYSTEKIKLNFENSTLLDGWDLNKEPNNTAVILRKDNLYYLGIMDKRHNRIFQDVPEADAKQSCYEKMVYKLLPGPNKMLPKVFFSKSRIDEFAPSGKILDIYENGAHKKGDNFKLPDCHRLIDFFKISINKHEDWKQFGFKFSPTPSYADLSGFYREVEHQGYKIAFQEIAASYIKTLVDEGKLYLFQIYNKDFSPYSKGKPNLHTLYWRMLFDKNNLKDVVYKLNGQAEVFYRKKSIAEKNIVVHKANETIPNRNPDNEKKTSRFDYDIVKDKRYTLDKFQFHVPITMNFKAEGILNINQRVNRFLKENPAVNIIGIDRGERHLLYYTLINQQGEILKQGSLNIIANEKQKVDYHNLLDKKESERAAARVDWGVIENIKELKEGYLSQVIHQLTDLMITHNAIIVMEDLNFGFKRGRQKVEKQVYQKFEKMLIDKLNYLVDKNKKVNEPGGLSNAFQLANKFESFQKMGKQNGVFFYVPAWNTSKTDPVTGFVDLLKPSYENLGQAKEFFGRFKSIRFNSDKNHFEFAFDYKDFTEKAEGSRTEWTVCTTGEERYAWNKTLNNNKGGQGKYDVTEHLRSLFDDKKIEYKNGEDLKPQIALQESADFFKLLMKSLSVTLSLRYNNGEKEDKELDYILSPVADSKGRFFDSRKVDDKMPQNADANGAYHIALKGLWCLQQINETKDLKKVKLAISNKEWLQFVQNKPFQK